MHNSISIRPFIANDAVLVQQVALKAWQFTYKCIYAETYIHRFIQENYHPKYAEHFAGDVRAGKIYFSVATNSSEVIGFCHIGNRGEGFELFRIYLLPSSIGNGIGTKLLTEGEAFLTEKACEKYFCYVHSKNEIGKQFYIKQGFVHIPEKDDAEEWYMEKILF